MFPTLEAPRARSGGATHWLLWLALFWLFSYAVLTLRAQVEFGAAFQWLHEKRAVGVTVGALLFGGVLHLAQRLTDVRARAALLVASVLPAAVIVIAARSAFDLYVLGTPSVLGNDLNWTIVWAGYFGLSLGVCLAVQHRVAATRALAAEGAATVAAPADYHWLVDALAAEMARDRDAPRILADLRQRTGYLRADADDPVTARHNARVQLVERLAERLER